MELNRTPTYDDSDNLTGCCPQFKPEGWDDQVLHFKDKMFVKAATRSLFHVPLNMGKVFAKTSKAIEQVDAYDMKQFVVLTREISPWKSEHYFAVTKEVPGEDLVHMNGEFVTQVFEGLYKEAPQWYQQMQQKIKKAGKKAEELYFFYTTCPKCAKVYGKNYVVGFAKTA